MNCLGVTGSGRAADLLTRQPGTDCSAEPQALTSTCSRQPPPCLRESSLVSAAACGPGCSQGQRGLVTCRWPFTLRTATATGLASGGELSHTHFSGQGLCTRVYVYAGSYTCTHFHTAWSPACIHAYFQTCAHLYTQANDRCRVCSEHRSTSTQRHKCRQTQAYMYACTPCGP